MKHREGEYFEVEDKKQVTAANNYGYYENYEQNIQQMERNLITHSTIKEQPMHSNKHKVYKM